MRSYNEEYCVDQPLIMRTDLSKNHKEIVNKALELNKVIKSGAINLSENQDHLAKALQQLEFSENTVNFAYENGLQFADDVATPAIGNWTFGSLNMIVQEVGSSLQKDTLLSLAFPDKSVPEYKVLLDRIVGNSGILPEFGGDSSTLQTVKPLNTYGLTYEPGLWAGRTSLTAKHIMNARKRGIGTFAERGIGELVAYNSVNMVTQAMTRKKYTLNQAIFYNGFSWGNGNTSNNIASNIPSGNYVAMYEAMGTLDTSTGVVTYATSDPLYTPFVAITNILNNPVFLKYRRYIRGIVCNGADLQAMMNHPNVKAVTNFMVANSTSLSTRKLEVQMGDLVKELNAYYAPSFDFPLLADDDVWVNQDANGNMDNAQQNFFVPRGKMYVLLDLTEMGGQNGAFHLTYNEVDPNIESPAMGLFTGVFNRNLNNSDTTNRLDIVAALSGAPAVYMPEAQFVLTGLYSNV